MARLLAHHGQAPFDRILSGRFEQFVDKGLDRIAGMGVSDRTPPQYGNPDIDLVQVAFEVGKLVGRFVGTFIGGRIHAVLESHRLERRALHDRLPDDGIAPGFDLAVADHAAHAMNAERAIIAAAHVVLAGPDHLTA